MDKVKLRMAYLILNVFLYVMFIGFSIYVIVNRKGIYQVGMASYWFWMLLFLLFISLLYSMRIRSWIKKGKL